MTSTALESWNTESAGRLAELEQIHLALTGDGRGRRWGTTQLNRHLLVALVGQFQTYCRALHDEAMQVHANEATPSQATILKILMGRERKLDTGNPRRSALGSDFGRLGIALVPSLRAQGQRTEHRLELLEQLVDFRNAISHGNEGLIAELELTTGMSSTKTCYKRCLRALRGLASTIDRVVAEELATLLGVPRPW